MNKILNEKLPMDIIQHIIQPYMMISEAEVRRKMLNVLDYIESLDAEGDEYIRCLCKKAFGGKRDIFMIECRFCDEAVCVNCMSKHGPDVCFDVEKRRAEQKAQREAWENNMTALRRGEAWLVYDGSENDENGDDAEQDEDDEDSEPEFITQIKNIPAFLAGLNSILKAS